MTAKLVFEIMQCGRYLLSMDDCLHGKPYRARVPVGPPAITDLAFREKRDFRLISAVRSIDRQGRLVDAMGRETS
jgi:hypothetical protein